MRAYIPARTSRARTAAGPSSTWWTVSMRGGEGLGGLTGALCSWCGRLVADEEAVAAVRGPRSDWEAYRRSTLRPLDAALRAAGVGLEAASHWGPWGPCVNCSSRAGGGGVRERVAACRLRVPPGASAYRGVDLGSTLRAILDEPLTAVPCRSSLLAALLPSESPRGTTAQHAQRRNSTRGCVRSKLYLHATFVTS